LLTIYLTYEWLMQRILCPCTDMGARYPKYKGSHQQVQDNAARWGQRLLKSILPNLQNWIVYQYLLASDPGKIYNIQTNKQKCNKYFCFSIFATCYIIYENSDSFFKKFLKGQTDFLSLHTCQPQSLPMWCSAIKQYSSDIHQSNCMASFYRNIVHQGIEHHCVLCS
jgi:hypothetical protein